MNSSPKVSVILPAYNSELYIEEAIKSILQQTYEDIEVIIIDDCSTDTTLGLAQHWQEKDKRISVYVNDKNLGVGANRSLGIMKAKGEYVCWQDADDISLPERISLQADYLDSHPDVGVVGGFIVFFDKEGDGTTRKYAEGDTELRSSIFRYNPIAQPASMFRKKCYEELGGYDESYTVSEDLEMLFRIGERYKFANVQSEVLKYRQTSGSLTAANLKKMERVTLQLRRKYKTSPAYRYTPVDWLFNIIQRLTIWMPMRMRMKIFSLIRGDK